MSDCNKDKIFNMKKFSTGRGITKQDVEKQQEIGSDKIEKCMDIFQRTEASFLPEGKKIEDLTPAELAQLKRQYRYDYYRPGLYQGITGLGKML